MDRLASARYWHCIVEGLCQQRQVMAQVTLVKSGLITCLSSISALHLLNWFKKNWAYHHKNYCRIRHSTYDTAIGLSGALWQCSYRRPGYLCGSTFSGVKGSCWTRKGFLGELAIFKILKLQFLYLKQTRSICPLPSNIHTKKTSDSKDLVSMTF
mgnify:CR=1 FL=1